MEAIRTFIAVDVSDAVKRRAADVVDRLRVAGAPVKWVEPARMHITLQFLGNVSADEITAVCQHVEQAVHDIPSFQLHCEGLGGFPSIDRPRVVWLGCSVGSDRLIALHRAVESAMERLGFPPERREFHPHMTLGRIRRGNPTLQQLAALMRANATFDAGTTDVHEVCVYSSSLKRQGPEYTPLSRAELG